MQNSSGDGNDQDSHQNQHYSLNFPTTSTSESFFTNTSSASSVSYIPGLLRLAPTSPMGMPVMTGGHGVQSTASHNYTIPVTNTLKRTSQDAGFADQRQCEMPSSDDDNSLSEKFTIPQTSVSPETQSKMSEPSPSTKKTKGRVKIKMEFIDNKLRRYTTFSKRKTGIMKKAYELSTLTGTQVMLLVASETGHVYTFATRKLQPMITSEAGKALIQTCLNSPDPSSTPNAGDQRMSATGFEETELCYNINEDEQKSYEEDDDDGVEEITDKEDTSDARGDSNGYLRRLTVTQTPATAASPALGARSAGSSSAAGSSAAAATSVSEASRHHQLLTSQLTSQLLTQMKQQQLALQLAATSAAGGQPLTVAAHQLEQLPETSRVASVRFDNVGVPQLFQSPSGLLQLPEGLVLLNSPSTVIQAVKNEHAGEPPNTAQPTDLSKSRVSHHVS